MTACLQANGGPMLDPSAFLRPIAHRGLHDLRRGIVENTASAFHAAIAKGYGIECDLRPARSGLPVVFHDLELDRLIDAPGDVTALGPEDLKRLRYRAADERILTFAELLELAAGRVPLVVEVKSEWDPPDPDFLKQIAALARDYKGLIALKSFDPAVMVALRHLAPAIPRGIVSGGYPPATVDPGWWQDKLGPRERFILRHLLRAGPVRPSFISYHVKALPSPATTFFRRVLGIPLMTWTVRTAADRAIAAQHADAIVFEGFEP